MQKSTGTKMEPVENRTPTLEELGIDKKTTSEAQLLAATAGREMMLRRFGVCQSARKAWMMPDDAISFDIIVYDDMLIVNKDALCRRNRHRQT